MNKYCIVGLTLFIPLVSNAAVCGSLAAVKDKVEVLRIQATQADDQARYAIIGKNFMPVECNDIVQTGPVGSAKVILGNDKITLAPDSRIEIAQHSGNEAKPKVDLLNLTYGKMRGLIQKRAAKPGSKDNAGFRVKTRTAVAGVRGTDLFMSFDPNSDVTEQAVIEGKVEVTKTATNETVLVEAGKQVTVTTEAVTKAPLKVVPLQESVKQEIRVASVIAKDDKDFAAPPAVKALGEPATWTLEREGVPDKLKGIKNEF